jgi:hypothetical protein
MSNDFIQIILGLTIVLIGAAASYAIATIASYYKSKREQLLNDIEQSNLVKYSAIAKSAVETIDTIVMNVVTQLDDTVKKEILAATSDGKLSEEEKTKLKDMAMDIINREIADPIKEFAASIVGDLDAYISTAIENCVTELKAGKNPFTISMPYDSGAYINDTSDDVIIP